MYVATQFDDLGGLANIASSASIILASIFFALALSGTSSFLRHLHLLKTSTSDVDTTSSAASTTSRVCLAYCGTGTVLYSTFHKYRKFHYYKPTTRPKQSRRRSNGQDPKQPNNLNSIVVIVHLSKNCSNKIYLSKSCVHYAVPKFSLVIH